MTAQKKTIPRTAYTPDSQASHVASSPGGRREREGRQEREMVVGDAKKLKLMRDMYHGSLTVYQARGASVAQRVNEPGTTRE